MYAHIFVKIIVYLSNWKGNLDPSYLVSKQAKLFHD